MKKVFQSFLHYFGWVKRNILTLGLVFLIVMSFQNCGDSFKSSQHLDSAAQLQQSRQSQQCDVENGSGEQFWENNSYGPCRVVSCDEGYRNETDVCIISETSCPIDNGNGIKQLDGTCIVESCTSNYHVEDQSCKPNVTSCSVANGMGDKTWNGTEYSVCTAKSCNAGYKPSMGFCVAINEPAPLFPAELAFQFLRGTALSLKFVPSRPFPSDVKALFKVTRIDSEEPNRIALLTEGQLKVGNILSLDITKGSTQALLSIKTLRQPLYKKTDITFDVTSTENQLPKKVTLSVQPKPTDVVDGRFAIGGPTVRCFALNHSGQLYSIPSSCRSSTFNPATWKLINSTANSKITQLQSPLGNSSFTYLEQDSRGTRVHTQKFEAETEVLKGEYTITFPVGKLRASYDYGIALSADGNQFSLGTIVTKRFSGNTPLGTINHKSPIGKIRNIMASHQSGKNLIAVDSKGTAHWLATEDYTMNNSYKVKESFNLNSPVVDLASGYYYVVMLTQDGRLAIKTFQNQYLIHPVTFIPLTYRGSQPVAIRGDHSRFSISFADGFQVHYWLSSTSYPIVSNKYLGPNFNNELFFGWDTYFNQLTNKPSLF